MPKHHWLNARRKPPQHPGSRPPATTDGPAGPDGFWLTDTAFLARLHTATLALIDIADNVMEDDFTLTEALAGARHQATDLLGIPIDYGLLAEAEAAAQIVAAAGLPAGSPFAPAVAHGLARIDAMPVERQQQLVRAAGRRFALTAPPHPRPTPPASPPKSKPGRSR
ncbi:hypothetical protein ACIRQP_35180 [Streptomyces sp. NPDC102274]|uniref:hypothetical protein n=1 Tax=Streptomyces sp. NPDC102274 TaxID=3366151 RepID=UPI0037F15151